MSMIHTGNSVCDHTLLRVARFAVIVLVVVLTLVLA